MFDGIGLCRPYGHVLHILVLLLLSPLSLAGESHKAGDTEISFTHPAGGESWREGGVYYIKWAATSNVDRVILFAASGGKEKGYLAGTGEGIPAKRGFFRWQIPERFISGTQHQASDDVRLMICSYPKEEICTVSNPFTVTGPLQESGTRQGQVKALQDPGASPSATCVNGWEVPAPNTPLRVAPLDMIRSFLGLSADDLFIVDEMRYFIGPEDTEISAPRRDVERWYVRARLQNDPSIKGRWMIRRLNIGQGVAYRADYASSGYETGTWTGQEGEDAEYDPFQPPCTADHGPYCMCDWGVSGCSCSDAGAPACTGPPPEVMGCLDGT